ncbi:hypothetical protein FOVSG1_012012 [Fusarium oxysporum f. sp. vasinfectum]
MPEHLTVTAILSGMADAFPTHPPSDNSSDLASSYEAIALLIHSYLAALGFKLQSFDEDKKLLIHDFQLPVNPMGKKVEILGLAVRDDNIYRFERSIGEVVKSNELPISIIIKDNKEDRSDLAENLRGLLTSEQAIADILHDLKVHIIQKLIPKLRSEGYIEPAEAEVNTRSERRAHVAQGPNRPCHGDPILNYYMLPPPAIPRPEMARAQPHQPYNISHDDLNLPGLGPHDPLRGSFTGGLPQPGGGSVMHPTFDNPLFGGQGGDESSGFDPQVPPGARWDPTGPGGNPRFPGPSNGRGSNPFGGDII